MRIEEGKKQLEEQGGSAVKMGDGGRAGGGTDGGRGERRGERGGGFEKEI